MPLLEPEVMLSKHCTPSGNHYAIDHAMTLCVALGIERIMYGEFEFNTQLGRCCHAPEHRQAFDDAISQELNDQADAVEAIRKGASL